MGLQKRRQTDKIWRSISAIQYEPHAQLVKFFKHKPLQPLFLWRIAFQQSKKVNKLNGFSVLARSHNILYKLHARGYRFIQTLSSGVEFSGQSNTSQSCVILVEDCGGVGAHRLPTPNSNVSHLVATDTASLPLLKGLEFLAFRLSSLSTKL